MLDYKLIGRRIRAAREREKLSQLDMAGLIDVSATHISLVEKGKKGGEPRKMISRVSDTLGVTIDALVGNSRHISDPEYLTQIGMQLEGCSDYEKRMICEMACAA